MDDILWAIAVIFMFHVGSNVYTTQDMIQENRDAIQELYDFRTNEQPYYYQLNDTLWESPQQQ